MAAAASSARLPLNLGRRSSAGISSRTAAESRDTFTCRVSSNALATESRRPGLGLISMPSPRRRSIREISASRRKNARQSSHRVR
jgi:hypothetical protein